MLAHTIGDAVHARFVAEIDRKAAGAVERRWVELQPPGAASARQAAAGDGNVRIRACARDRIPVDPVSGTGRQQPPFGPALANDGGARISRTGAVRKRTEISRVAVESR